MTNLSKKQSPNLLIGIMGCFGGMFIHLIVGSVYQWGIINVYITSYYHLTDDALTLQSTAIAFPVMMTCIGLTMKTGLSLAKKSHPLIVMIVGQFLNALMILISSFMPNIWLFILFYGVFFGLTVGINFTNTILQCNKYLIGKKMYVNGLILVGTGSGSVIFGTFSYNFINPNDVEPLNGYYVGNQALQQIANQSPILLRWLSLMYLIIGLIGVLMITPVCLHNRKVENEQKKHRQSLKTEHQQNDQTQSQQQLLKKEKKKQKHILKHLHEAHSIKEAVKTKVFLITILIVLTGSCGCFLINGNYKTYVKTVIHDDRFLTTIGVVGAVGNGCCRFFWNLFFSKTGFKTVCLVILSICAIVLSTIRFSTSVKEIYLIEVFLINSCLGGLFVITPTAALYIYGNKTGTNIYGIYWSVFSLANLVGYFYVSQLSKLIGFDGVIYTCLGMVLCAFPLVLFNKLQGPWENDTIHLEYLVGREEERNRISKLENSLKQNFIP